jgi:hypothetical protein
MLGSMPPSLSSRRRRAKRTGYTAAMRYFLLAKTLLAGASVLSLLAFMLMLSVVYGYNRLAEHQKLMPRRNYIVAALVFLLTLVLSVYMQIFP